MRKATSMVEVKITVIAKDLVQAKSSAKSACDHGVGGHDFDEGCFYILSVDDEAQKPKKKPKTPVCI